jgi:hypothetical protein
MNEPQDYWDYLFATRTWFFFYTAASVIEDRLGVSGGVAQRTLRQVCASGDIRSKHLVPKAGKWEYETIKPTEWAKDEIDIQWQRREDVADQNNADELEPDPDGVFPGPIGVYVNGDDFRYWLSKQEKLDTTTQAKTRARGGPKFSITVNHLRQIFPKGVPDECTRKVLKADLVKKDPRLFPLDEATLKTAIDEYNRSIRNDPT